jgi:hypothetical protein
VLGRKVSDEFTVPLCRLHHRELHRARNEADWWVKLGIDAIGTALKLWKMTRSTNVPPPSDSTEPGSAGQAIGIVVRGKARARRHRPKRAVSEPAGTLPTRA